LSVRKYYIWLWSFCSYSIY